MRSTHPHAPATTAVCLAALMYVCGWVGERDATRWPCAASACVDARDRQRERESEWQRECV